ncbi:hypothetical protein CAPGI0001_0274 [Capnocytophaga gingivalis ATCC 33624]|uniref:MobC family replication-relaxation protein n=1 Tax=Capnocytophaga gingivalis TaxID=1017 RepID=UPI00019FA77F|nr:MULTISPECIES: MobC family replication-relaxation protein [Bacteria]EEK14875.1 hypothetical protein CAPGI0001_0274 [Capnocytophaga gingivalis ATCC 33624]
MNEQLISDYKTRKDRSHEKIRLFLEFLKEETYTDRKNIMRLFSFKDTKSFYSLTNKMVNMGLIQKYVFTSLLGELPLWGITREGLSMVIRPEDETVPPWFEPSKIKGWGLEHHLFNQNVRLILEEKSATEWINGDRRTFLTRFPKVKHRPDGLIKLKNGTVVAIETERYLKTPARYTQIMISHLMARTAQNWFSVIYVLPDEQKKLLLKKYFDAIKVLSVNSSKVTVEQKHRDIFNFYTLAELEAADF